MLAGEIPHLAGLWLRVVTGGYFATDVRIKMTQGGCAVAVGRDGLVVDMVHYARL